MAYDRMIGIKDGDDIVQEYTAEDGRLNHWIFTEITTNSFHRIGKSSTDEGKFWRIEAEFFAKRSKQIVPFCCFYYIRFIRSAQVKRRAVMLQL